jgi:hypothetical protein
LPSAIRNLLKALIPADAKRPILMVASILSKGAATPPAGRVWLRHLHRTHQKRCDNGASEAPTNWDRFARLSATEDQLDAESDCNIRQMRVSQLAAKYCTAGSRTSERRHLGAAPRRTSAVRRPHPCRIGAPNICDALAHAVAIAYFFHTRKRTRRRSLSDG